MRVCSRVCVRAFVHVCMYGGGDGGGERTRQLARARVCTFGIRKEVCILLISFLLKS